VKALQINILRHLFRQNMGLKNSWYGYCFLEMVMSHKELMKEGKAMKCPKCRYVSHDYLDSCRKCHTDLVEFKRKFNLVVLKPGDLDLGVLVAAGGEAMTDGNRSSLATVTSHTPPGKFYLGLDEMAVVAAEIEIQFDPDTPNTPPGDLTKTFYVPEVLAESTSAVSLPHGAAEVDKTTASLEIDMPFDPDTPEPSPMQEMGRDVGHVDAGLDAMTGGPEVDMPLAPGMAKPSTTPGELTKTFYVELDELTADPGVDVSPVPDTASPLVEQTTPRSDAATVGMVPLAPPEITVQDTLSVPVKTIDISVGQLAHDFDEFEDIQLDTSEIDLDVDLAPHLSSTVEIEPTFHSNVLSLSEERHPDIDTGKMDHTGVQKGRENA
jgi:hypothetical protein